MNEALKDSSRGSSEGRSWIRSLLVVSEVAMKTCVLLVGAGLLIRSFVRVLDVDMGFQPARAATLRVDPPRSYKGADQVAGYFNEVLRRTREIPGVDSAGLTDALPLGKNRSWSVGAKGQTYAPGQFPDEFIRIISDGYFQAMRIPLRAGRDFTEHDRVGTQLVAIVNESMARRLWPGEDPIGKEVLNPKPVTVVGVVADVRHLALEKDSRLEELATNRSGRRGRVFAGGHRRPDEE